MTSRSQSIAFLKVDRSAVTPPHQQLIDQLQAAIHNGRLQPGSPLPSERDLSQSLGISRMTVRAALTGLQARGQLKGHVGKGWFVSGSKIEQTLSRLTGFSADMQSLGYQVRSEVLRFKKSGANADIAQRLRIEPGEPFYLLMRLRYVNDEPVGLEQARIAERTCPQLERFDFAHESLYRVMQEAYGLILSYALQNVEASVADRREADSLHMRPGKPVLRSTRAVYSPADMVLEASKAVYRGDRYKYRVRMDGSTRVTGTL
jgi:GntR family transcriptional regulator